MKLSVIIANHNYRDFVGAAIESSSPSIGLRKR